MCALLTVASALAPAAEAAPVYNLVYAFKGGTTDGYAPTSALTYLNGVLYGTTSDPNATCTTPGPCGTLYSLTPGGTETVLHFFKGGTDGWNPVAGLASLGGTLYGVAGAGGSDNGNCTAYDGCGTMFSYKPGGTYKVLYDFQGGSDGNFPRRRLAVIDHALYGTTFWGGNCAAPGCGTAYTITPSGAESVLYRFNGGADGNNPFSGLTWYKSLMYGTTQLGGAGTGCSNSAGCGTLFTLTTSGTEKVLYSFKKSSNGQYPVGTVVALGGKLYGTTTSGGAHGYGTVYSITTGGTVKTVYSFKGGSDGASGTASLTVLNGTLYGMTSSGGGIGCGGAGCGTVFSVTTAGVETVLHSFSGGIDGAVPASGLLYANGLLYGTTVFGGGGACSQGQALQGCGTVFSLSP